MVLEIILYVVAGISLLSGMGIVFFAPHLVKKYKLDEKKVIDPERVEGLDEDGVAKFKRDTAILDVKLKGILLALPGVIIILAMCKLCRA